MPQRSLLVRLGICSLLVGCASAPALEGPLVRASGVRQAPVQDTAERERPVASGDADDASPGGFGAYRKNYILATYDEGAEGRAGRDPEEVKFQISFRYPISTGPSALWFSYTARSFWQLFDFQGSSPFRTTDHEPEIFWESAPRAASWVDRRRSWLYRLGVSHQSNGEAGVDSRSRNRVVGELVLHSDREARWCEDGVDDWRLALRTWWVFDFDEPERGDFEDFLGLATLSWDVHWGTLPGSPQLTVEARNNFDFGENRGSVQVELSAEAFANSRLMVQVFEGYAENLLDYDRRATRIGVGFQLSP